MGDNMYLGCPARMEDGRYMATFVSSQVIVDAIKRANGIDLCKYDNNDMRYFMTNNATRLMNKERQFILQNNRCLIPKKPLIIELPYER